jgi:hypothetical protein
MQWIWRLIACKLFSRRKPKVIEASLVYYLSSLALSLRWAWRMRSLASVVATPGPPPAIVRFVKEIQRWICDAQRSPPDGTQMEFNALWSTPAPNAKFNFLGLIVDRVCVICDPSGRWYFTNFESIFYSCFSLWSSYLRSPVLVRNGEPYSGQYRTKNLHAIHVIRENKESSTTWLWNRSCTHPGRLKYDSSAHSEPWPAESPANALPSKNPISDQKRLVHCIFQETRTWSEESNVSFIRNILANHALCNP